MWNLKKSNMMIKGLKLKNFRKLNYKRTNCQILIHHLKSSVVINLNIVAINLSHQGDTRYHNNRLWIYTTPRHKEKNNIWSINKSKAN